MESSGLKRSDLRLHVQVCVLLKWLTGYLQGGGSLTVRRQQLEELYLAHSGSMSILMEADDHHVPPDNPEFPEGPANFTLLW